VKKEKAKSDQKKKPSENELLKKKILDYEETMKRLQAEFENYKKRNEKEHIHAMKCATQGILLKILPLLDSFESALNSKDIEKAGLELLYNQFTDILTNAGVRPIEAMGKQFDPFMHEVMLKDNDPKIDDDIITAEIQKGYMLNDMVLRHSKVKINQKNE